MKGKIQIGRWTISTAKRIRNKISYARTYGFDKSNPETFWYVVGVYDSRIFGICFYRNSEDPFKKKTK